MALDCEMVGVGEEGEESSLARASMVDIEGRIVLDEVSLSTDLDGYQRPSSLSSNASGWSTIVPK